ncbi:MAG: CBS domain-containing protein [Myxococcales bacterium]|nr:CBS domain-containing protein [Myxococcales bacterium]
MEVLEQWLPQKTRGPQRRVCDVMTGELVTVAPETLVDDALRVAVDQGVHHLLVTRNDDLVGQVCAYDLAEAAPHARVADCMCWQVVTISVAAPLGEAAATMREHAVGCLPVLWRGVLLGVVTRGDLRRAGLPDEVLATMTCASCGGREHVRLDPRNEDLALCVECRERARPPEFFEDLGGGD